MKRFFKPTTKDTIREILKSISRFLSIFAIIALGTGFFAGLKSTYPNMALTANTYFREQNLMDMQIKSTLGFTESEIETITALRNVQRVEPAYTLDAFADTGNNSVAIMRCYSTDFSMLDDEESISTPLLVEGRMPQRKDECVMELGVFTSGQYDIGSTIQLFLEEDDIDDYLNTTRFTIVGIVTSPMYISFDKGSSTIGNGVVNNFLLLPIEVFEYEVYTDVFLTFKTTEGISAYDLRYDSVMDNIKKTMEDFAAEREQARYDELYNTAREELDKARAELDDGWQAYYQGIEDLENGIAAGRKTLEENERLLKESETAYGNGIKALTEGWEKFEAEKPGALAQLQQLEALVKAMEDAAAYLKTLTDEDVERFIKTLDKIIPAIIIIPQGVKEAINEADIDWPDSFIDLINTDGPIETDTLIEQIFLLDQETRQAVFELLKETQYFGYIPEDIQDIVVFAGEYLLDELKDIKSKEELIQRLREVLGDREALIQNLEEMIAQLRKEIKSGYAQLADAEQALIDTEHMLRNSRRTLDEGWALLKQGYIDLEAEELSAQAELDAALAKLQDGEEAYSDGLKRLEDIPYPTWYLFDRADNSGYSSYIEDAERVDKIAIVIPVFFILVAALVCLTTMTRMVEENRMEIGTMKALGYSNGVIAKKYLVYAISASLLGSFVGLALGFKLLPVLIFNAYRIMYLLPDLMIPIRWDYAILCTAVAVLCTALSAYFACRKELLATPAALMRPKAPKAGKRVFLEKVSFIWSRLSFLHKVTFRNLFRYKKRVLMTVVGVAGCTALMYTGFGLQHAITSIVDKQYEDIFIYDAIGIYDEVIGQDEVATLRLQLQENEMITDYMMVLQKGVDVTNEKAKKSAYLLVPENAQELNGYINLQNRRVEERLSLPDHGCILTEKIAKMLDVSVGEKITVSLSDTAKFETEVAGITENYTMNYIYMSKEAYASAYKPVIYNSFILHMNDPTLSNELSTELLRNEEILHISYSTEGGKTFRDVVGSLNYIVLVVIIAAGALAFIVLYNLVNINVNERLREIATIKVLGFYDNEVGAYIYRETNIASVIGVLAGLLLGMPFKDFVISVAEVDSVMFAPGHYWLSFVLAAVLTFGFAIIVDIAMHFKLKKVDMVESLKSVE